MLVNPKDGIATLSRLFPYLLKYKVFLIIGTLAMLVNIGITFYLGFAISSVIDGLPKEPTEFARFLDYALLVAVVIIISSNFVGFISNYCLEKVAIKVTEDIRCQIFSNIIRQELSYIEKQSSGDLQTRIVADASAVGGFLAQQVPMVVSTTLRVIAGVIGALVISSKMTLILVACVPFVFLPFLVLSKRLRHLGRAVQSALSDVGRFSGEVLRNIKVVRTYNKESTENKRFASFASVAVKMLLQRLKLNLLISQVIGTLGVVGFAILIWSAGKDINNGIMSLGQLVSFSYFALFVVKGVGTFLGVVTATNIAVGTSKKVIEYLSSESHSWSRAETELQSAGAIEFNNIGFNYPTRPDVDVLKGVSFSVKPGEHVALVGSSGAGKSTVFELLLRLYDVQQGDIYFGGENYKNLDVNQIRKSIGYVPQKESLISGTVKENISYGLSTASKEDIILAAKIAHAHDFIERLPQQYDTNLGEVANLLSGGQKQRIALARALIREPDVLLLDEAKSALDASSERLVAIAIEDWANKRGATVISITHSLSTVRQADQIVVMDDGLVVGQGTHEELMEACDIYRQLAFDDKAHSLEEKDLSTEQISIGTTEFIEA